jgi:CRP/FNR family transcriptional regulator, cyclic AMP receptor protein
MKRTAAIEVLSRTGWLSRQPEEIQHALFGASSLRSCEAGEAIYSLGDDPGGLFGLAAGQIKVLIAPALLPPTFVSIAQPGWWVGEAALISKTPRRAELTAKSRCTVLHIGNAAVEKLAAANPELWRSLAELTVSHLDHALATVATLAQKDPWIRVVATLAHTVSTSLDGASVTVPLTHDELGEMTRLSRVAVRKILLGLQSENLLQMNYGRLEISNPRRLAAKLAERANEAGKY